MDKHRNAAPAEAVLDTNAVLAIWWFADRRVAALRASLEAAELIWWATPPMRDELGTILARLGPGDDAFRAREVLGAFDRWARIAPVAAAHPRLRCRDRDDQPFIDLAIARRASWLFTRDRDLLRMRRGAAAQGLLIVVPESWPPPQA